MRVGTQNDLPVFSRRPSADGADEGVGMKTDWRDARGEQVVK